VTFEHAILIRATPGELFALTQDYARRLEWDPFLRSAELLGGAAAAGVGVRANCVATMGLAMETEYVSFNPPNVTAVKMTRGPWFLRSFAGSWRFHGRPDGRTRVAFRYHLSARPAWLAPLLGLVFAHDTRNRLDALRRAVKRRDVLA
jgi:ribosome-associated toxin RatA of RatAB toxin-antitoxin module